MDKLEEIKKHHRDTVSFRSSTTKYEREHAWLISEVERLRGNFRGTYSFKEADYQRRHRKWALEEARTNLHDLWWVQESQTHKDKQRAEKAEAELADCKAVYEAHATEAEKQIDELQAELANIREANRGMLYVINELQAELSACKERVGELEEAIIAALGLLESPEILDRIAVETLNKALQAQEQREGE